ncbi:FAD-dependent oxidoreductase [Azospirillum thermophilum]|uniref:FAD-dependent oxidoreductase n=1 Tax=Azospirillum thermophilum TaxID=2202148 RepID=A0A2S2CK60_9PROT|nr:FAD-dependent oxidoreductase [Azospirillum thermophilum]
MLILGAGPSGVALACRLTALGWSVALLSAPRAPAWEGMSPRVVEGLRRAGCREAVAAAGGPVRRSAHWNGLASGLNGEHLVERPAFDAALLRDAAAAGVAPLSATVADLRPGPEGWLALDAAGRPLAAGRFLVEARGRRAPRSGGLRDRGPRTVAVARLYQGPHGPDGSAASAAAAFPDGWAWMARLPDGRRMVQVMVDAAAVPARGGLTGLQEQCVAASPEALAWIAGCAPLHDAAARDATAVLRTEVIGPGWLRIGDAAFTGDPLSGHGVHAALSGAFAATAAVNTLLADPGALPLVRRFVEGRCAELFAHGAAVGNAFYRQETRWADRPFWRARAAWPPAPPPPARHGVRHCPVVIGDRIEEREVLVTPQLPRGVLTIEGVELAPLMRLAGQAAGASAAPASAIELARRLGQEPPRVATALAWLGRNGFLGVGGGMPLP